MNAERSVIFEVKDHVARVSLNVSEVGNAIDGLLAKKLEDICAEIRLDKGVCAVIITGEGEHFCTGCRNPVEKWPVSSFIASIEQPVIAAINGDAMGQGLEIALACDIRVTSDSARFSMNQITVGYLPFDGGTQRLPRIIGKGRALDMILTGKVIGADEALEIGLVHRVVSPGKLISEVETLARTMAARAPLAMRYAKEAVLKGMDLTLEQGIRLEADLYYLLHTTDDRKEGINAFRQKRNPEFRGM